MSSLQPEGTRYWRERTHDDQRRDWRTGEDNWIAEYTASTKHPHRDFLIHAIASFEPVESVFEIGCNAGANLMRVRDRWPDAKLGGVDVNSDAAHVAQLNLPAATIYEWDCTDLPLSIPRHDVVLADAVLMYLEPHDAVRAIRNMLRIARKGIVICDWVADDQSGIIVDGHWARNYPMILKNQGLTVERVKLTEEHWPTSTAWVRNGEIIIGRRA